APRDRSRRPRQPGRAAPRRGAGGRPDPARPDYGALAISLAFEQHWGMRDGAPARRNGHAPRADPGPVVAGMLDLFEEFDVAATWATVGFLFARTKRELEHFAPPPPARPAYANPALDPYAEPLGDDE